MGAAYFQAMTTGQARAVTAGKSSNIDWYPALTRRGNRNRLPDLGQL